MNGGSDNVNPTITFSGGGTTTQATGTLTVTNGVKTGVYKKMAEQVIHQIQLSRLVQMVEVFLVIQYI